MSIVGCNNPECWYAGNLDRLDEFKRLTELRVNGADAQSDYDVFDNYTIYLCDVCVHNGRFYQSDYFCSICGVGMLDPGTIEGLENVCCACAEDAGYPPDAKIDPDKIEDVYEDISKAFRQTS